MTITFIHSTAQHRLTALHTGTTVGTRGHTAGHINRDACPWADVFIPRDRESVCQRIDKKTIQ